MMAGCLKGANIYGLRGSRSRFNFESALVKPLQTNLFILLDMHRNIMINKDIMT